MRGVTRRSTERRRDVGDVSVTVVTEHTKAPGANECTSGVAQVHRAASFAWWNSCFTMQHVKLLQRINGFRTMNFIFHHKKRRA